MKQSLILGVIACLLPIGLMAQPIVWPGDANNNGLVSHIDILYVGLGYGNIGPSRPNASLNWSPQMMNSAWVGAFNNGANYAHGDCNGSGLIDSVDTDAIDLNYGRTVQPSGGMDSTSMFSGAFSALTVDIATDTAMVSGQTVILANLSLGDSTNTVDSLYGIAFSLSYDPALVDSFSFDLDGGWLAHVGGGDSTLLTGAWIRDSIGQLDVVITRTDQINSAGFGLIGSISIVMDDNIRVAGNYNLPIDVVSIFAVTSSEAEMAFRGEGDSLAIVTPPTSIDNPLEGQFSIYPNPAHQSLTIAADNLPVASIYLYDGTGKVVRQMPAQTIYNSRLALNGLPPGIYFLELRTTDALLRKKIVLLPH